MTGYFVEVRNEPNIVNVHLKALGSLIVMPKEKHFVTASKLRIGSSSVDRTEPHFVRIEFCRKNHFKSNIQTA
jgi:hypothetical protein